MSALSSPFRSIIINIAVDSTTLYVHRAFVESASPRLLERFQKPDSLHKTAITADLKAFSLDVGHVLVNWLYTGTYQLLERPETAHAGSCAGNLRTAFGVYSLAREFDLSGLEALAREQLSLLGTATDVFTFIDVIEEAYPRTVGTHDGWLEEYITTRMKEAVYQDHEINLVETTTDETEAVVQEEAQKTPISKLLVKGMLEACREVVKQRPEHGKDTTEEPQREIGLDSAVSQGPAAEAIPEGFPLHIETRDTEVPAKLGEKGRALSDIDDWVSPSPKGKEVIVVEEHVPEPEPSVPEAPNDDDLWGSWGTTKKGKKKGDNEPEEEMAPADPAPEPEPSVREVTKDDDPWGAWGMAKKDKKKKKCTCHAEPQPEPEPEPVPEPEEAPAPPLEKQGVLKKKKKKARVEPEPEPEPVEEPIPET